VFFSVRVMVGIGLAMLVLGWVGAWQLWRRNGFERLNPWVARAFVGMAFSGWVATLAGWYTTEIGRQPWLVSGVLQTADAVADVPAGMVGTTFALYLAVYATLTLAYVTVLFQLARKAAEGGTAPEPAADARAAIAAAAGMGGGTPNGTVPAAPPRT
jgi:cytochrome d ubiquinol oxidase subunit I